MTADRNVLLVQLPIPPPGPTPVRGNVPLAAGYLKLYARRRGLDDAYNIEIFPTALANGLSDVGLVDAILARDPWLVGFSCYLWNIDRTLWVAERLKARRPDLRIVLGGPEVTADNQWVLDQKAFDYAVVGEGEQTFAALLESLRTAPKASANIDGLYARGLSLSPPRFRTPLPDLNEISSPYLEGILDAADEQMLLLETIRGCVYKCKFCYYPKSYDGLYFLPHEKVRANLEHARRRGAREVVLLDPTLNQRKDFTGFLRLLAEENPDRQFTYFGELRAEGVTEDVARHLAAANFTEIEIGLQSIDPHAQELMARRNTLRTFERGAKAMLDAGVQVKVDLIIGLPGDTPDSIRRGFDYLLDNGLYSDVQVFQLAILPGTAFRQEVQTLGLVHHPRPPYDVLKTPTRSLEQMIELMDEGQDAFGIEFDPLPPPKFDFPELEGGDPVGPGVAAWRLDLDRPPASQPALPAAASRAQAFTVWFRGSRLVD
ncbi:MAG: B12-binding domain-containing radical SAM protein, partial [Planctomycetia bacterium]